MINCNYFFLVLFLPFFISCSNKKEEKKTISLEGIRPPFEKFNIPFTEFEISNDSSYEFHLPTGTHLSISPGSFARKNAKPLQGKIQFKVREFHDAMDLLRSGIPMNTGDSANQWLQTAGMIELRAFANGEELQLAEGKELGVELAAKNPADRYSLYYFDQDKNWQTTGSFVTQENKRKKEKLAKLIKLRENSFQIQSKRKDLYVDLVADFSEAPYVEPLTAQLWKIDAKDANDEVVTGLRINWDEVKVKELEGRKGRYLLEFSSSKSQYQDSEIVRNLAVEASPVSRTTGEAVSRAEMNKQLQVYEKKLKVIENEQLRLQAETDLQNKFRVNKLGIWNIDKLIKMEDYALVAASFDFEQEVDPKVNKIRLFSLFENDRAVMEYAPGNWDKVYVLPGRKMKLLALLPGEQIAEVDSAALTVALKEKKELYKFSTRRIKASDFFK